VFEIILKYYPYVLEKSACTYDHPKTKISTVQADFLKFLL